ncbi:MAG: CBS domain-containing protein [Halococcoides sp.]
MSTYATVREVMSQDYVGVSESDTLAESVEVVLRSEADGAVVLRGQEPIGIVTKSSALRTLIDGVEAPVVADAMIERVPTIDPESTVVEAIDELSAKSTSLLAVWNGEELIGVVSPRDLLAAVSLEPTADVQSEEIQPETTTDDPYARDDTSDDYSEQSVCEACGSLAADLASVNGQLLCADCRSV